MGHILHLHALALGTILHYIYVSLWGTDCTQIRVITAPPATKNSGGGGVCVCAGMIMMRHPWGGSHKLVQTGFSSAPETKKGFGA